MHRSTVATGQPKRSAADKRQATLVERFDETGRMPGLVMPGRHRRWRARKSIALGRWLWIPGLAAVESRNCSTTVGLRRTRRRNDWRKWRLSSSGFGEARALEGPSDLRRQVAGTGRRRTLGRRRELGWRRLLS